MPRRGICCVEHLSFLGVRCVRPGEKGDPLVIRRQPYVTVALLHCMTPVPRHFQ